MPILVTGASKGIGRAIASEASSRGHEVVGTARRVEDLDTTQGAGRLLYISSVLGHVSVPTFGAYAASKWGLEALAETLAKETAQFGIRVSILQPGLVATGAPEAAPVYFRAGDPSASFAVPRPAPGSAAGISPMAVAKIVVDVLEMDEPPLRIPFAPNADGPLSI